MVKMRLCVVFLTFFPILVLGGRASAKTLYYDDFDGLGSVPLNTTVPDIAMDDAAWQAGEAVTANGALGSLFTAALPFVPETGTVYELSATIEIEGDWAAIGFLTDPGNLDTRILDNGVLLWCLTREAGSSNKDQAFVGPGTSGALGDASVSGADNLMVRLETTSETEWQVTWFLEGVQEFQTTVDPATMEINYIAFGTNGYYNAASGTISRFKLVEVTGPPELASEPVPEDGATDVHRDAVLGWIPGEWAATHDVYFGSHFDDVNNAGRDNPMGVLLSQDQAGATYDPEGLLELGQTYYWRIDEVNAAPDSTVFKGQVWSFTAEPLTYPVEGIVATANVGSVDGSGPENMVNGSGLNENGEHSVANGDMWLSETVGDELLQIDFAFDRVYKLSEMLVWNCNVQFETMLGLGPKDITVEYSANGVDWSVLADVVLAQGTARGDYTANTTIDFAGVAAQYVRLTVHNGYGTQNKCGLAEVRFMYVPVHAREPEPVDGATEVTAGIALSWRAGREAVSHEVYLSTDAAAVSAGTAPVAAVETNSYTPTGLDFGQTYYWRVDEVNEAEAVAVWEGSLWSFISQEYAVLDGFESYNDDENRIYDTWVDGWINGTGSTVGYMDAPFAERVIVYSGRQSLPLAYDNSDSPFYSEMSRTWGGAMDWIQGGADTVRVLIQGDPANAAETLYLALEDNVGTVAVVTHPDTTVVQADSWVAWEIPLSDFSGLDLSAVKTLYMGVGDRDNPSAGGTGSIYIDDIGYGRPADSGE